MSDEDNIFIKTHVLNRWAQTPTEKDIKITGTLTECEKECKKQKCVGFVIPKEFLFNNEGMKGDCYIQKTINPYTQSFINDNPNYNYSGYKYFTVTDSSKLFIVGYKLGSDSIFINGENNNNIKDIPTPKYKNSDPSIGPMSFYTIYYQSPFWTGLIGFELPLPINNFKDAELYIKFSKSYTGPIELHQYNKEYTQKGETNINRQIIWKTNIHNQQIIKCPHLLPYVIPRSYTLSSNTDYPYNDIKLYEGPQSNCAAQCDATPGCIAYVNDKQNGKNCWLKSSLQNKKTVNNRDTYYIK
jgi:hypothetical protein